MFRKIGNIGLFIALLFFAACSAIRNNSRDEIKPDDNKDHSSIIRNVKKNNISLRDFKVSRFRANIVNASGNSRSVVGFLKYSKNGDILISLRSMAGIEVARGLVDNDSVRIYDRINKILYLQSNDKFRAKYGLDNSLIKLVWGDLPDEIVTRSDTGGDELEYYAIDKGVEYIYNIDNEWYKLAAIKAKSGGNNLLRISYRDFKADENYLYPGEVAVDFVAQGYVIDLSIKSFSFEKTQNMKFKVDNNAERVILR